MLSNLKATLEAIDFQKSTKFGDALAVCFQAGIDYKNELDSQNLNHTKKCKLIREFCLKKLYPSLKTVIKTYTNINVVELIVENTTRMTGSFYVMFNPDEHMSIYIEHYMQYGHNYDISNESTKVKDQFKNLMTLAESLDLSTGKFKKDKAGDITINCKLGIDHVMAFLLDSATGMKTIESFTAKELAAIYMHEVGHMTIMYEKFGVMYYTVNNRINGIVESTQKATVSELVEAFEYLKDSKVQSQLFDPKNKVHDKFIDIITAINAVISKGKDKLISENSYSGKFFRAVASQALGLIAKFTAMDTSAGVTTASFVAIGEQSNELGLEAKVSDMVPTLRLAMANELDADTYVVRSGYGAHLASGLNRLFKLFSGTPIKQSRNSNSLMLCVSTMKSMYETVRYFNLYEDDYNRVKSMMRNTIGAFKSKQLSQETKYHYLKQYEDIEKTLSTIQKPWRLDKEAWFPKYVSFILTLPFKFLFDSLSDGGLESDYLPFQHQLEELIDNKFYYQSAKFASLLKK